MSKWDIRSPLVCDSSIVLLAQQMIFLLSFLGIWTLLFLVTTGPKIACDPTFSNIFRSTNNYEPETIVTLARVSLKVRIKKMRANENNLGLLGNCVWPKSHQGGECRSGLEVEPHLARSTLESSANFRSPSTANGQKFLSFSPDWFTPTEKMRQKVERWKKGTQ